MTREMNKPDWCNYNGECNWWTAFSGECCRICKDYKAKQRVLDEEWKPFIDATNERYRK